MQRQSLLEALGQILSKGCSQIYIWLDATASGSQVCGAFFGAANDFFAQAFNLRGGKCADTYGELISRFAEENTPPPQIAQFVNRKVFKKAIMIANYNGTARTCVQSVVSSAGYGLTPSQSKQLSEYARDFHKFLTVGFEKSGGFFARSVDDLKF